MLIDFFEGHAVISDFEGVHFGKELVKDYLSYGNLSLLGRSLAYSHTGEFQQ